MTVVFLIVSQRMCIMRDEQFKKIACTLVFHICSSISVLVICSVTSVTEQKSYKVFTN